MSPFYNEAKSIAERVGFRCKYSVKQAYPSLHLLIGDVKKVNVSFTGLRTFHLTWQNHTGQPVHDAVMIHQLEEKFTELYKLFFIEQL